MSAHLQLVPLPFNMGPCVSPATPASVEMYLPPGHSAGEYLPDQSGHQWVILEIEYPSGKAKLEQIAMLSNPFTPLERATIELRAALFDKHRFERRRDHYQDKADIVRRRLDYHLRSTVRNRGGDPW